MDIKLALEQEKRIGISVVQVVKEEYEMILLNSVFQSSFGKNLVFRGGTALRLGYGSFRFSDDLDFSQIKPISLDEFNKWCLEIADAYPNLELVESLKKHFTLFAFFKIKDPAVSATISIKIEISTRKEKWTRNKDYVLLKLLSSVTPITVLAQVASVKKIQTEKLKIDPKRIRDIFDLWFISQLLKEKYEVDFSKFKVMEVKRELNRLLTLSSRRLVEQWLTKK